MSANLTVTPIYDSVNKLWFNQLNWSFLSPPPEGAEVIVSRSISQTTGLDASQFTLFELIRLKNSQTSYTDRKVEQGYVYYYNVRGSNEEPEEVPPVVSVSPVIINDFRTTELISPINFKIDSYSRNSITFSWNFPKVNKNPIFIDYSKDGLYYRPLVSNITPNSFSYKLNNFYHDGFHAFKIYTKNEKDQKSAESFPVSLNQTFSYFSRPQAPTDLTFAPFGPTTGKLSWTNTNPLAENLEHLIWITSPSGPVILYDSILAETDETASSIVLTNLASGTEYCFRCQARSSGGDSELSLSLTGQTQAPTLPPSQPENPLIYKVLEVLQAGTRLQPSLYTATNIHNVFYTVPLFTEDLRLFYSINSDMASPSSVRLSLGAANTAITNIPTGVNLYYQAVATNSVGAASSNIVTVSLIEVPNNPTGLSVNLAGEITAFASWTNNNTPDPNKLIFNVLQLSGDGLGDYGLNIILDESVTSVVIDQNTIPFNFSLSYNTSYNVRIFSVGYGGYSGTPATWASATFTTANQGTNIPPAAPKDTRFIQQISPISGTVIFDPQTNTYSRVPILPSVEVGFIDGSVDEDGFEYIYYPTVLDFTTSRPIVPLSPQATYGIAPPAGLNSSGSLVTVRLNNLLPTDNPNFTYLIPEIGALAPDLYAFIVNSAKGDLVTRQNYAASPLANVSGSTDQILYFEVSSFVWGASQSAVDITGLASSMLEVRDERGGVLNRFSFLSGQIVDPFSAVGASYPEGNYGDWYVLEMEIIDSTPPPDPVATPYAYFLYSQLSSPNGYFIPVGNIYLENTDLISVVDLYTYAPVSETDLLMRTKFILSLDQTQNQNITLRARKVYNAIGVISNYSNVPLFGNLYSSGIARTCQIGDLVLPPKFLESDDPNYNPERDDFFIAQYDEAELTITLKWRAYTNTNILRILRRFPDGGENGIYDTSPGGPADGRAGEFVVTGCDFSITNRFEIVLYNVDYETLTKSVVLEPFVVGSFPIQAISNLSYTNPRRNVISLNWELASIPPQYGTLERLIFIVYKDGEIIFGTEAPIPFPPLNSDLDEFIINLPQNGGSYTIRAVGKTQNSFSQVTVLQVFMAEPSLQPPTNFRFTTTSKQRITLAWDYDNFSTSYKITKITRIGQTENTEFISVPRIGAAGSFSDVNLITNSLVTYSIQAVGPTTESLSSNSISFTVPKDPQVVQPPTVVDAPRACIIQGINPGNVYYQVRRS